MSANFNHLLNVNTDQVERPKPLPTGTFTFVVAGHEFGESAQKKTPFVRFKVKPISPGPDVDQSLLPENWRTKEMKIDFYLTEDARYRLKDYLEQLGLNITGRTFSSLIPETTNQSFLGTIVHEPSSRNPQDVFANIGSTARAA